MEPKHTQTHTHTKRAFNGWYYKYMFYLCKLPAKHVSTVDTRYIA